MLSFYYNFRQTLGVNTRCVTAAYLTFIFVVAAQASGVDSACPCAYRLPALQELYDATNGAQWVRLWNMTAVDAPCNFDGVVCGESDDISNIVLSRSGLYGTLPSSLGQLSGLVAFDVSGNFSPRITAF